MTDQHQPCQVPHRQARLNASQRGFTLIELIMVIVMLGVLAVFAAPRMFNSGDFYARGFHDETLGLLRYAQKAAIAQRRTVCVTIDAPSTPSTPNTATLSIASVAASSTCDKPLSGPNQNCTAGTPTGAKGCITARSGVSYSSSPAVLRFDGLGQPVDGAHVALPDPVTLQVAMGSIAILKTVTVEPVTGYVHD